MYDAGSRQDVRRAEKASRQADLDTRETIVNLMSTASGRHWVHSLLETAGIFHSIFSSDPLTMAFNEGRRNQGLQLLNDIMRWCPDDYVQMMRESNARSSAAAEHTRSQNSGRDVEATAESDTASDSTDTDTTDS